VKQNKDALLRISYCIEISIFDEAQLCAELERTILALGYFCSVAETYFVNAGWSSKSHWV